VDFVKLLREHGLEVEDARVPPADGVLFVDPEFLVIHHTASNRNSGALPSKSTVRFGRGGSHPVKGPLCQLLIGRGGELVAITDGKANQAGMGSSLVLDRIRKGLPPGAPGRDDMGGNGVSWGWEVENDGIGEPYSAECYEAVVAVTAVVCIDQGFDPAVRVIGHKEWTRRKIDPTYSMPDFRVDVAEEIRRRSVPSSPTEGDKVQRFIKRGANGKTVFLSDGLTKRGIVDGAAKDEFEKVFGVDPRVFALDPSTFDRILDVSELDDHPED
jgi:hypothetical protein